MTDAAATTAPTTDASPEPTETPLMARLKAEIKEFEFAPSHILQRIEAIARNHFGIAPAS